MNLLRDIRLEEPRILALGIHGPIIQSVLDFDFLCGKTRPSIVAIVAGNRKAQKYFFGDTEILIPCFPSADAVPRNISRGISFALVLQSGRRAYDTTVQFFDCFPEAHGAHIFAENVPEKHATELIRLYGKRYAIFGPSGVGFLVPGSLKLGAVGGTDPEQIQAGALTTTGAVAVVSTSGGMTNELIRAVVDSGHRVSFAASIGGDRFPVTSLTQVLAFAESDPATKAIVYFGELGGADEYEIVAMKKSGKLKKPVLAYIAGVIDNAFDEHVQFGHAKALVRTEDESASAKRTALGASGVLVSHTFPEFLNALTGLPHKAADATVPDIRSLMNRKKSILSTRKMTGKKIPSFIVGKKLKKDTGSGFAALAVEALLGRPPRSPITTAFTEAAFSLLIDHGGNVSGAVNTMVTARAGKDMVSSLSAGLLTVGPRFGGAINEAARTWLYGVHEKKNPALFVEAEAKKRTLIPGIGHRKYRVGLPDPRVKALGEFAPLLKKHPYLDFAQAVEHITTSKNGNLILNVDGVVAALLLDILTECEGATFAELSELVDSEFFNAFFIIPRSVGFIGHYIEQKRNDEGLFRLPDELLYVRDEETDKKPGKGRKG